MGPANDKMPTGPEGASRDNAKRSRNLLEVQELQKLAVPIALDLLLITLDQCRFMLDSSRSPQANAAEANAAREYGSRLSARERKELDKVVEQFHLAVEERVGLELEKRLEKSRTTNTGEMYPIAEETLFAMTQLVFSKVNEETAHEFFERYSDDYQKFEYILTRMRIGPGDRTESLLGASLVPMIVSKMEEFLGALIRAGLGIYPNSLGDLPSIPNDIFQRYQANVSSSDITRWQIDQKVSNFISGSPRDWQRAIERWTSIDIANIGADWDILVELIQRRHAIIHSGGRVDAEYLNRIAPRLGHGLVIGSYLISNSAYISPVLVEVETWATCLALRWVKHFFNDANTSFPMLGNRIIKLESLGRWSQALTVLDSFLLEPLPDDRGQVAVARINRYFCLQELGRDNEALRREIQSMDLNAEDQGIERAARHALLGNYPELIKGLRELTEGQNAGLKKRDILDQPLFSRAMNNSTQVRNFLLVGGGRPTPGPPPKRARGGRKRR